MGDEGATPEVEAVLRGLDRPADPSRAFADGLEARLLAALAERTSVGVGRDQASGSGQTLPERGQALPKGRPPAPMVDGAASAPAVASSGGTVAGAVPLRRDGRGRRVSPTAQAATAAVVALALLGGAVLAWLGARGPTGPGETADVPYGLYVPDSEARGLLRLDPLTLRDYAGGVATPRPGMPASAPRAVPADELAWLASADGSTLIRIEEAAALSARTESNHSPTPEEGPESVAVVILDGPTGRERARFQPPVWPARASLSADGSLLVLMEWEARWTEGSTVETVSMAWHVVATATGRTLGSYRTEEPGVLPGYEVGRWGGWDISPDGRRLYRLVAANGANGATVALAALDPATGAEAWRRPLPGLAGGLTRETDADGRTLERIAGPGLAVSPDGRDLAILAGDGAMVAVVDAQTGLPRRNVRLDRPASDGSAEFVDDVDEEGGQPPAAGTLWSAVYAPDGASLFVTGIGADDPTGERQVVRSYGVRRVDLASGAVEQGPAAWVHELLPSPDGLSLYVLAFAPEDLATPRASVPFVLRRLDAATLRDAATPRPVVASDTFGGQGVLIVDAAAERAVS